MLMKMILLMLRLPTDLPLSHAPAVPRPAETFAGSPWAGFLEQLAAYVGCAVGLDYG